MSNYDFYDKVLDHADRIGLLKTNAKILVVCGGQYDRSVLLRRGLTDVIISNIGKQIADHPHDAHVDEQSDDFTPFRHAVIDAECIDFEDNSFDVVVEHLGLHHCHSPHKALVEMYRVSRHGVVFIENRDSALIRLATKVGLCSNYEIEAVLSNDFRLGGVANTNVPNYVYRWTESEVEKTLRSYDPKAAPNIDYVYGLRSPSRRLARSRNRIKVFAGLLLTIVARGFNFLFPRQCNMFGVIIQKPQGAERLWPWMMLDSEGKATINREWCHCRYRVADHAIGQLEESIVSASID